jgi:two-component system KDP operon response regulator KdpE
LQIGDIQILPVRRLVSKSGRFIHLTRKEYDILHYLMTHAGRAVTYGKLLGSVWGVEYRTEVDYLRTFIRQLRKKIEDDPSNPRYLLTDAYVGYRFAEFPPGEPPCDGPITSSKEEPGISPFREDANESSGNK